MIGVVIPAHNEENHINRCVISIIEAASHPGLNGMPVRLVVVLDACTDATEGLAASAGAMVLNVHHKNVGKARGAGAELLLNLGVGWLAFTDADTIVPPDWLFQQIEANADAVCGIVEVDSWRGYGDRVREHYLNLYQFKDEHRHVHGANLGVSAQAYRRAGGFQPLPSHEDVCVVADLERTGARIAWTSSNPAVTSARTDYKCREGFGEYLANLAVSLCSSPSAFDSPHAVNVQGVEP